MVSHVATKADRARKPQTVFAPSERMVINGIVVSPSDPMPFALARARGLCDEDGNPAGHQVEPAGTTPEPPAKSASKSDWVAYARQVSPDADVDGLTKDQLVERFGG